LKAWVVASVALVAALALTACGSSEESEPPGAPHAPLRVPSPPPAQLPSCPTAGHDALRVNRVGCSDAERIVRGFTAEGGKTGTVLTVNDFVCQEQENRLTCARGNAVLIYTAHR
jgi:hypothetical protein